jgi:hypothetical protein
MTHEQRAQLCLWLSVPTFLKLEDYATRTGTITDAQADAIW